VNQNITDTPFQQAGVRHGTYITTSFLRAALDGNHATCQLFVGVRSPKWPRIWISTHHVQAYIISVDSAYNTVEACQDRWRSVCDSGGTNPTPSSVRAAGDLINKSQMKKGRV
jgi:hypothetical protein